MVSIYHKTIWGRGRPAPSPSPHSPPPPPTWVKSKIQVGSAGRWKICPKRVKILKMFPEACYLTENSIDFNIIGQNRTFLQ